MQKADRTVLLPDALASLRQAGMQISSNVYPHVWPWHFSRIEGSP